ncbi:response regulator [Cytophagaceae bacterium DM2B3-1]|uniref:Response regulator n=2 Tax=Xanthocytophaga TaxID=3078918 RepID=A0AAE3UA62_9BACT|nr:MULTISPECIES: response regulator [Xanthocytophaga]MDJ1485191.1 response regulator [Xanthocytophaga flavus]MDJ1496619.1 response regulator [Xanthocytophaga flavus]MDJ1504906.1 response regulator [Xanthocytophaga agilis]
MPKKVMLVDDMEIANFISKKIIQNTLGDVEVYDFTSPKLAYEQIEEIHPDIILLDLNMPVMDGWAFLERMQAENKQDYKVLILTSSTSEVDKEKGMQFSNVLNFCSKPLNKELLVSFFLTEKLSA